jgi:hypothetical protein
MAEITVGQENSDDIEYYEDHGTGQPDPTA